MLIEEKQKLIDSKDWDALVNSDFLNDWNLGHDEYKEYTVPKEIMSEFFCNKKRIYDHIHQLQRNIYHDDVWENIIRWFYNSNIELSIDDWKAAVDYTIDDTNLHPAAQIHIINMTRKGVNFYKMLLDDTYYAKCRDNLNRSWTQNQISSKSIAGLNDAEVKALIPRMSYEGKARPAFSEITGGGSFFAKFFDTIDEMIPVAKSLNISAGVFIKDVPVDEFEKWILDAEETTNTKIANQMTGFYQNKKNVDIPDEVLDKFIELLHGEGNILDNMITTMTEEQIRKYIDHFRPTTVAGRRDISIQTISEMFPNSGTFDLSGVRFAREEEMVAHPKFFNPEMLKRYVRMYCSKETFKLLNRAWGKRQRYNENLNSFSEIFPYALEIQGGCDMDIFTYLIEKTGATNEQICNALQNKGGAVADNKLSDDLKPLIEITKFLRGVQL